MLTIVAPGQGAQTPGFLAPWLELPPVAARIAQFSDVSGLDLAHHGAESDAETIRDTAIAQPLLVAAGLAAADELLHGSVEAIGLVAGHSVGEVTAAAIVGVLDPASAMLFVRERGRAMAAASAQLPTSMTAIVGGDRDAVLAAVADAGLTAANHNGSGQVVAAGTLDELQQLAENPPARARLIPLSVAGAFHTVHMAPAAEALAAVAATLTTHPPRTSLLSNRDGAVVADGGDYLDRLVSQVANPVRWDLCLETLAGLGVTGLLELPPAGTLAGIAKRNLKGVELFILNTPDQLDDARAFVARHAAPSTL